MGMKGSESDESEQCSCEGKGCARGAIADLCHAWCDVLLAEPRDVPHSHRLVKRRRHNQVVLWVELCAHDLCGCAQ